MEAIISAIAAGCAASLALFHTLRYITHRKDVSLYIACMIVVVLVMQVLLFFKQYT